MTQARRAPPLTPATQALFEQGCAAHQARNFARAETCFRAVLANAPAHPATLGNLAEVLRARGKLPEALAAFEAALAVSPNDALLRNNHGNALSQAGRGEAAIAELQHSLALDPSQTRARTNLGNALLALGRLEEARAMLEQVVRERPDSWPALASLGAMLLRSGQNEAALPLLLRAVKLEPRAAEARASLASALAGLGFIEESLPQFRAALQLLPGNFQIWSAMIFALHHGEGHPPRAIFEESARFGQALERAVAAERRTFFPNDRSPARRLRVGYVSPDLRRHPVGFFLERVLEAHDARAVEVFAYSDTRARDDLNQKLRAAVHVFRDTAALDDSALAKQIAEDRIDVLVDLAGHTTGQRLAVFARKPAPVQMSWLGYPDTTGLSTIDYRITDAVADPPGEADALHTERLLRLPHCFIAWAPREREIPSAPSGETITFGCFNNIAKLSPRVAALWARILLAVPGSRLLLKSRGLALPESRARLLSWFSRAGIHEARIALLPFAARPEEALRDYGRVDIALDPFPYNGTTTTCEALSSGVPLIALRGASHAGRVSASILESLGLPELVASNEEDYLRISTSLAHDRVRLSALRASLPERFRMAPVGDPQRLARELEGAFRAGWLRFILG